LDDTIYCLKIQLSLTFILLWLWRGNCTQPTAGFDPVWLREIESSIFYILKNSKDWQLDMKVSRGFQLCTFVSAILFSVPSVVCSNAITLFKRKLVHCSFRGSRKFRLEHVKLFGGLAQLVSSFHLRKHHSKTTAVTPGNFVCGNSRIKLRPSVLFLQKSSQHFIQIGIKTKLISK